MFGDEAKIALISAVLGGLWVSPALADPPPPFSMSTQTCVRDVLETDNNPAKLRGCLFLSTDDCLAGELFVMCAMHELNYWDLLLAQELVSLLSWGLEVNGEKTNAHSLIMSALTSQNKWEAYLAAQCGLVQASMLGGSGDGPETIRCQLEITVERVIALQRMK